MTEKDPAEFRVERMGDPTVRRTSVRVTQLALERAVHSDGARSAGIVNGVDYMHRRVGGVSARETRELGSLCGRCLTTLAQFILHLSHRLEEKGTGGAQVGLALTHSQVGDRAVTEQNT